MASTSRRVRCVHPRSNLSAVLLMAVQSGHQPAILVWDIQARTVAAELKGHKYGIAHLAFTPNGRTLVSVGVQHDACINVWDLKTSTAVASAKLSGSVRGCNLPLTPRVTPNSSLSLRSPA